MFDPLHKIRVDSDNKRWARCTRMALIHSRKEKVHTLGAGIGGQSRDGIWLLDDDVSETTRFEPLKPTTMKLCGESTPASFNS